MTFNIAEFELASAQALDSAFKIDKLINKSINVKQTWATLACQGILAGKLTLDDVQAQLIADYRGQVLKGKAQAEFDVTTAKISHCGNTIKGWYHDLATVVKAGQANRVIKGEALTTVRRDTKPRQEQGKSKTTAKTSDTVKSNMPSLNEATAAIRHYVAAAKADSNLALELATNKELAAMISDIAALEAQVTAAMKKAAAKAAKAAKAAA